MKPVWIVCIVQSCDIQGDLQFQMLLTSVSITEHHGYKEEAAKPWMEN